MLPTIVVTAFNRPQSLQRLLASIQRAEYPPGEVIRLLISIDRGENNSILEVANRFEWEHGEKLIIYQEHHLGLLKHFYYVGNLSQEYEAIIHLEDDLVVSPMFYTFTWQALEYYNKDNSIGGISLYSLWYNGYTHQPFVPLPDESDIFFLQIPYHQGYAFTRSQWEGYSQWLKTGDRELKPGDKIHELFLHFDEEDWFPIRTKYLIETSRFYVYPRESLSTGFAEVGVHFTQKSDYLQVPLQRFKDNFRLKDFSQSIAVYDSFFEILPGRLNRMTTAFQEYSYAIDLYGTKSLANLSAEYVLTTKRCKTALASFGKSTWPIESNIIDDIPGFEIFFCKKEDLLNGWINRMKMEISNYDYFSRSRFGKFRGLMRFFFKVARRFWRTY